MRCSAFRRRMVAFADGELPESVAQRMAEHGVTCPACAAELALARGEGARYGAAFWRHQAPPDLAARVAQAVAEREPEPARASGWLPQAPPLQWAYAVVGVAVLALLAFGLPKVADRAVAGQAEKMAAMSEARVHFAADSVQAEGAMAAPSGGPVYRSETPREQPRAQRVGSQGMLPAGYTSPVIRQAEPSVALEDVGPPGAASKAEVQALNKALAAPSALSEREQSQLNSRFGWAEGASGPYGSDRRAVISEALTPGARPEAFAARDRDMAGIPPTRADLPAANVDSTDATVTLVVGYREADGRYVTTYEAQLAAEYAIRAPDVKRKGVRIAVSFPFPNGCTTVTGPKLLVNGKEDESHTTYSIGGIRWVGWFEPKETKTVLVGYNARGEGSYVYGLDKNRLAKKFRLIMKVQGLEPGHEVEIPEESLQPDPKSVRTPQGGEYSWDFDGLLTVRDIMVNFPAKESPTALAERVGQIAGKLLPVARFAPLLLALYLGGLFLTGLPNPDRRHAVETLVLLGLAFLAFYPLFIFASAYLGQTGALWTALVATIALSGAYGYAAGGPSLAARSSLLQAVLLGAFTYALLDKGVTGIMVTVGVVLLLAYFMVTSVRRFRAAA